MKYWGKCDTPETEISGSYYIKLTELSTEWIWATNRLHKILSSFLFASDVIFLFIFSFLNLRIALSLSFFRWLLLMFLYFILFFLRDSFLTSTFFCYLGASFSSSSFLFFNLSIGYLVLPYLVLFFYHWDFLSSYHWKSYLQ